VLNYDNLINKQIIKTKNLVFFSCT